MDRLQNDVRNWYGIELEEGVDFFYVSTDEIYYADTGEKCGAEFNRDTKSWYWVKFAKRAHEFLTGQDRRMLAWIERPLKPENMSNKLPVDIIDAVQRGEV